MTGILYLVGTPIGNLEDITFRAIRTLKSVDTIYCEDTRVSRKLCQHYEITTPLKSYHEHSDASVEQSIIDQLQQGENIALISDAGLPLISDPGYELVIKVRTLGLQVETVPGPNAALTALMTSGISSYSFLFDGFLPRKENEKKKRLEHLMSLPHTSMIYESPFRVKHTLETIAAIDKSRKVAVARELTKKFEQVEMDTVEHILSMIDDTIKLKGEFVIVIDAADLSQVEHWWEDMSLVEHVEQYIEQGLKSKDAIKKVAEERNMKKSDVYEAYHIK